MRFSSAAVLLVALACHLCFRNAQGSEIRATNQASRHRIAHSRIAKLARTSVAVKGQDARDRLATLVQTNSVATTEALLATTGLIQAFMQPKSASAAMMLAAAGGVGMLGDMLELPTNSSGMREGIRAIAQGRHAQIAVFGLLVALKHSPAELLRPLIVRVAPLCVFSVLAGALAASSDEIRKGIQSLDHKYWGARQAEEYMESLSDASSGGWIVGRITQLADTASLVLEFLALPALLKGGFGVVDLLLLMLFWAYTQLRVTQIMKDFNVLALFSSISGLLPLSRNAKHEGSG